MMVNDLNRANINFDNGQNTNVNLIRIIKTYTNQW